jgi:hypothetical protein
MNDSHIEVGTGHTTFVGEDATRLFAAMTVRNAINLYVKTGLCMNRAYTPTNMRAFVTNITGKRYKRGKAALAQATLDLTQWIEAMKAAMPVEREGGR